MYDADQSIAANEGGHDLLPEMREQRAEIAKMNDQIKDRILPLEPFRSPAKGYFHMSASCV